MRSEGRRSGSTVIGAGALAISPLLALTGCGVDKGDPSALSPEARRGLEIAQRSGCTACHLGAGASQGGDWRGLVGRTVALVDGTSVVADTAYLTVSITNPAAKIGAGYKVAMATNSLSAADVSAVVAYIVALGGK